MAGANTHREPRSDAYDVVVAGGGLAGLTTAALLAKAGLSVLLVEEQEHVGGYARAFRSGPYIIDPACHFTADRVLLPSLLEHLGVADRVEIMILSDFFIAHFPDHVVHAPNGYEAFVEEYVRLWPSEELALRAFFALCAVVHHSAHTLPPRLPLSQLDQAQKDHPELFRYEKSTYAEVLDEFFVSPILKSLLAGAWPYTGVPPSRMSFLTMAQIFLLHTGGTIYIRGSFQSLVEGLHAAVELNGGEVLVETAVTKILVEENRVKGVVLAGEHEVLAGVVVAAGDARRVFEQLVGFEHLPAGFVKKLNRMTASLSAFSIYGTTKADLREYPVGHETFFHPDYDHEATYEKMLAGRPGGLWLNVPTLADPTLAPPGEHVVTLTALVPYDIGSPWEQERERFADELLDAFLPLVPDLREQLEILGTATPLTLERYAGNMQGATYGWANIPRQTESRRLSRVTPLAGLYLAGHWTSPGTGSLRSIVSGVQTAMLLMDQRGLELPHIDAEGELPPF